MPELPEGPLCPACGGPLETLVIGTFDPPSRSVIVGCGCGMRQSASVSDVQLRDAYKPGGDRR